jgi:hypothetical protein
MTWHPLVLAIWLLDLTAWAICLGAGWRLLMILPRWQPASSEAAQLWRERALALTVYQGRWVMAIQAAALGVLLLGISNAWVAHVPGAMCGTGVLQAMGPAGRQTLLLRLLTLLLLYCWRVVEQIDARRPEARLALTQGRLLLLAAPLLFLSSWRFGRAVAAVFSQGPVSCCAVVYDQLGRLGGGGVSADSMVSAHGWSVACFGGALLVACWGAIRWRRPASAGPMATGLVTGLTLLWIGAAVMGLKIGVAPYLFEVLYHPCPWCFFLWDHGGAGFVLFGLLAWIAAESTAGLTAAVVARRHAPLADAALERVRKAGGRLCMAALFFAALAAAPALLWRLRFGGWITG